MLVPDLANLTEPDARNQLGLVGLYLGNRHSQLSPDPGGRILSSIPPARTRVRKGSSVDYVENAGRAHASA